jgi:tetratricopeptide (TPR) repeat protein
MGFRVHLEARLAGLALVTVFLSTMAYGRTGDSCLGSPEVQELAADGANTQLPYTRRKSAYEQAIKLCPGQPSLYHSLAVLALQNHDFSGDLHWLRAGLRLWPENPQLQLDEAVALISDGHPEDSLSILTKLPVSAHSQFYLGMAERALGNHKAAQQALSKALDLGSQDPYVLYVLIEQDRDLDDKEAGLRDFQTLARRFPDSAWLHVVLGDAYMSRYEDSSAQSEYRQALAIDPHLPVIHFQLGCLAFSHDNRTLAAEEFRKEIDLDPAFSRAYLYLGLILRRDGKNREALPMLERAVALEPNLPLPYRALVVVQVNLNHMDAATETLRAAKKRFPSEPAFAAQLAVLLKQMGHSTEAEEEGTLAEVLSRQGNRPHQPPGAVVSGGEPNANPPPPAGVTHPTAPPVSTGAQNAARHRESETGTGHTYAIIFDNLRRCLEREDAAAANSALAAIRDPNVLGTTDYLELKAQTLALEHRKREALAAIETAVEHDPSQPHYLITQGRIYLGFGQPLDAITSFLNAAKLEPDSPEPLYFLGTSFFLLAQSTHSPDYYRRAVNHFQLALQTSPDYHRAEFMLGVIDAVQSRLDDAQKHLKRAIQLEPSNPYYHLHYGILLKHEGDNHRALGEMKTAEEMNPSYALTHFELGTVYEKLGQYEEARTQLQAALELNPDLSAPYYHLGAVYSHLGRAEESKAAFARFNVMKEPSEQVNSDPAAFAISDEEREAPHAHP